MLTQTKETQTALSPESAHQILIDGNKRFIQNVKADRNLKGQVSETSGGQYPFAVILSCIDSRVPVELVFDQGIGDVFSVRVAGNVVNEDVLGSMEYACKVAGSKIIVVLGHTKCGAVTAACKGVKLGNITALLDKIQPAVDTVKVGTEAMSDDAIESVTVSNVRMSIEQIKKESPILAEMAAKNEIKIVGGVYSVASGEVTYF